MVNMGRIVYRGSVNIVLGRWIDANDHMYTENLAVEEKQCPLFYQRFWGGGVPLFVIHPIFFNEKTLSLRIIREKYSTTTRTSVT